MHSRCALTSSVFSSWLVVLFLWLTDLLWLAEGFKYMFDRQLVTVWSAPNYCYRCGNVAAIMELDEHRTANFKIFDAAPHEARGIQAKKPQPDYFL